MALCFGISVLVATISSAQQKAQQQPSAQQKNAKLEQIAQYLSLTPQQKDKIPPILADEAPKVRRLKMTLKKCRERNGLRQSISKMIHR
jgi:hypothetical protein